MVLLAATLAGGCAVRVQGVVEPAAGGARLTTSDGGQYRLVLLGDAQPVGRLDGHIVAVEGNRALGAVRVTEWTVLEGVHGMSTWVGPLAAMGSQLGIQDRNSGAFYWVDDAAARRLGAHAGELVLVEGYVDGPHRVRVLYFQLLGP